MFSGELHDVFYLFVVSVLCGGLSAQSDTVVAGNFVGRDFYLGIPLSPDGQTTTFDATIGTPFQQADYAIESNDGEIASGTTTSINPIVFRLNSTFQVTQSGFEDRMKGIRVRATGQNPIYILVTMRYNDLGFFVLLIGYGSYLIHPNNKLPSGEDYVYYAVSAAPTPDVMNRDSNILLVGNHDDTTVSITPTQSVNLPENDQINSSLVTVDANTTHNVTLSSFQTLLISHSLDLTGTKIVSDKPLTVISGHQCAQIPSTTTFCEPIYVHLLPTFNWGQDFLLTPFGGRTASQYYKLVASEDSTVVHYTCGNARSVDHNLMAGSVLSFSLSAGSYCSLNASSPVFLVQMAPGNAEDNVGDPALTIVAPITGHVGSANFVSLPSSDFPNSFIAVTVLAKHFSTSQIQLDGSPLPCSWVDIYNSGEVFGYGCTYSVSAGSHVVSHTGEAGILSVLVNGWSSGPNPDLGYAYLANYNLGYNGPGVSVSDAITTITPGPSASPQSITTITPGPSAPPESITTITPASPESITTITPASPESPPNHTVALGVGIGCGVLGATLLLLVILIWCLHRWSKSEFTRTPNQLRYVERDDVTEDKMEMTQNQLYGVSLTISAASGDVDQIEMTQDHLYEELLTKPPVDSGDVDQIEMTKDHLYEELLTTKPVDSGDMD